MAFISITRLRLRSLRYFFPFTWSVYRTAQQARRAPGFLNGQLIRDAHQTFWTITAWEDEPAMRQYRSAGAHRKVLPKLSDWCDEASVVHWQQDTAELPSIADAYQRMVMDGRLTTLRRPSVMHTANQIIAPQPKKRNITLKPVSV